MTSYIIERVQRRKRLLFCQTRYNNQSIAGNSISHLNNAISKSSIQINSIHSSSLNLSIYKPSNKSSIFKSYSKFYISNHKSSIKINPLHFKSNSPIPKPNPINSLIPIPTSNISKFQKVFVTTRKNPKFEKYLQPIRKRNRVPNKSKLSSPSNVYVH